MQLKSDNNEGVIQEIVGHSDVDIGTNSLLQFRKESLKHTTKTLTSETRQGCHWKEFCQILKAVQKDM